MSVATNLLTRGAEVCHHGGFSTPLDEQVRLCYKGEDAITSASVEENEDVKFEEISQQIDQILIKK